MKINSLHYSSILVILYSIYDYFEHIGRPDSVFKEHPYYWLFFTLAAVGSILVCTYGLKYFLEKVFKAKHLLLEIAAVGIWLISYIYILGPIINKLFWPFDELFFSFKLKAFVILLSIYFGWRLIINLVRKKKLFFSE